MTFCRRSFITLKYLCDQGERGAAGLDGRPGLDGKPGVSGLPGQRVGGSYRFFFYVNTNDATWKSVFSVLMLFSGHRGILGNQVIPGEMYVFCYFVSHSVRTCNSIVR